MVTPENNTDTFSARLSQLRHDLRTPVGHIMGYAELIGEDMTEAETKNSGHDLQAIHGAGQKMLALVDDHFSASKTSLNDIDLHDAQFQLRMQLNHIAGYAEMMREEAIDDGNEGLLGDLNRISDAQRTVVRILNDIGQNLIGDDKVMPASAAPAEIMPTTEEAGITGIGGEILIVDDDPANRELLTRRMERSGYVGTSVASGQEALDLLQTRKFDLILLDQIMPGMSGLETLQAIQAAPRLRKIPVIMLSAADASDLAVQCILSGAEDYVAKPFNPVLLTARINASLEKVRLRRNAARRIKVFISSPGDVIPERMIAKLVLSRLNDEFSGAALLIPILWEEEPLLASDTFQAQIHPPRETDICIGILWSRIGSPLPETITREDGSLYESGTAFEFEDALAGYHDRGSPEILLYRKGGAPEISLADRDEVLERVDQMDRLAGYIEEHLIGDDGSYASAFHMFETPDQFETMLEMHVRKLVERLLVKG